MADASLVSQRDNTSPLYLTANAAIQPGEIWQLPDGRAGFRNSSGAAASGSEVQFKTDGHVVVTKTSGIVILDGGPVYWDHSANEATYRKNNDRDFFLGTAIGDAASSDTSLTVNLNVKPEYLIDFARDPFDTAIVGTQALGGLALNRRGGGHNIVISSINEAQKVDMLSKDGFANGCPAIVEYEIEVVSDGSGTVVDVSIGVANATHASDADAIAESVFCHLDANNANINFESDDGVTEVAATDSGQDYTEGTRFYVWLDMRNDTDVRIYVNGVEVLASTTFNVTAGTGPWKLLVHVEKSASTDTYELDIDAARVRIAQQFEE